MRISTLMLAALIALSSFADAQTRSRPGVRGPRGQPVPQERREVEPPARPIVLPTPDGDLQVMLPEDGATLQTVISAWAESTGQKFSYKDVHLRGKPHVMLSGITHVKKEDVDWFFQGLIVEHGFAIVPVGPEASKTWSLEPIEQSRRLKATATYIPPSEAASGARHPARIFMTTFALKEIEVSDARMALQQLLVNRQAEWAQEVRSSNSIVVVGAGPTIASIARLVEQLDKPLPDKIKKLREAQKGPGGR